VTRLPGLAAIVEPADLDIELLAKRISVAIIEERDADRSASRHEQQAAAARETAKVRRREIGEMLLKARGAWPTTGPKAKGWGAFLERIGLEQSTAWRYMEAVRAPDLMQQPDVHETPDPPAHGDAPQLSLVPDAEPDPEVDIDRDTWCTPPWITEAIGRFDLDPCSNDRSTVQARHVFDLAEGALMDGLKPPSVVEPDMRVFINPPYSDVPPWIAAYKHTRFCFLLKLDTSTRWFAELHAATQLILIPRRRVNFVPPPGVPPEKAVAQQFPHALFYAHAEDATDAIRALCWEWRITQ